MFSTISSLWYGETPAPFLPNSRESDMCHSNIRNVPKLSESFIHEENLYCSFIGEPISNDSEDFEDWVELSLPEVYLNGIRSETDIDQFDLGLYDISIIGNSYYVTSKS